MNDVTSIMIVGVGGQGTLLAGRILGNVLVARGYDVKVSEVHGMSQRGGSVVTYVKYGEKVYSPIICEGEADFILAFEELEAERYMPFLKNDGCYIINTGQIMPMPVITGAATYPENITATIANRFQNTICVDALSIALQSGNIKAVNVVLLGVLAKHINIEKDAFAEVIKTTVPQKLLEVNLKAFDMGYEIL